MDNLKRLYATTVNGDTMENYLEAISMSGVDKDYAAEYREELLDVLFAD